MNEPLILDGKGLAKIMEAELAERAKAVIAATGRVPVLATILVGNDPASCTYVRMKGNACARVGIASRRVELPETTTTEELLAAIRELNEDDDVCGILLQHPVPRGIDERACFDAISPSKDVDGVGTYGFGACAMGMDAYRCATPCGIITLLHRYNIPLAGRHAVVIGRSPILGKPVAMLLLNENCTVTICHSRTENLPDIVRTADIVVAAVGKPNFVQADWIREGAVLVDAGYNPGNVGDIDLAAAAPRSSAYTPVPGGVGPMTIASLIEQTIQSAEKKAGLR